MSDTPTAGENSPEEGITPQQLVDMYKLPGRYDDTLLQGMHAVDWASLEHAYGKATDVPALFRAILSDNRSHREFAYDLFFGNIWHQGTVYEASSHAVPFLRRLLTFEEVPDKALIVALLGCIATGTHGIDEEEGSWAREYIADQGLDFDEELRKANRYVQRAHETVKEGLGQYISLLDSPDAAIRDETVPLLCSFPESQDVVCPALYARIRVEEEPSIQASMIEKSTPYLKSIPDPAVQARADFLDLCKGFVLNGSRPAPARFKAAVALVTLGSTPLPEGIVDILIDAALSPPDLTPVYYPEADKQRFRPFDDDRTVEEAVATLSHFPYPENIQYLLRVLNGLTDPERAHFAGVMLLGLALLKEPYQVGYSGDPGVEEKEIRYGYEDQRPLPPVEQRKRIYPILIARSNVGELSPEQKEALRAVLDCNGIWKIESNFLEMFGFSQSRQELRRQAG